MWKLKPKSRISERQEREKALLLEQLEKTPIVQMACEKTWIARSTYYRWADEDSEFYWKCRESLKKGISMMNDMAESQLLRRVNEGNMTAVIFWLKSRHCDYGRPDFGSADKDEPRKPTQEELDHIDWVLEEMGE